MDPLIRLKMIKVVVGWVCAFRAGLVGIACGLFSDLGGTLCGIRGVWVVLIATDADFGVNRAEGISLKNNGLSMSGHGAVW
jgi:hypothetical protein